MKYFFRHIFVFFLGFLGYGHNTLVSDSTKAEQHVIYDDSPVKAKQFDAEVLKEIKKEEAFNYVDFIPPDNLWTRFKTWLNDLYASFIEWILNGSEAKGILGFLIKALPYLLLIGVVALLVWLFLKIDMGGSPLKSAGLNKVILADEQHIIETQDIQQLINTALEAKNYQLAVRYYYLLLLQQLAKKDIIDWQVQKTNADYVYEIKNKDLRKDFTKLTRIYDFIWYGNFEVNEADFNRAEREFKKVTATL